jgi:lipopolysaccharide export system protein LptA
MNGAWRAGLALAAWMLGTIPALAQGFNLSRNNNEEIQVYADGGIEWINDAQRVIARTNAKAIRGRVTVTADTLTAYYRKGAGGDEIWRLDADGNVTIATPTETATGTKATYDLDKAIFVLRGQPAHLVTPTDTVTAKDTIEYWEKERMAVARGDAVATQKGKQIQADVLTSHFKENPKGDLEMRRADAYRNVILTTPQEQVFGERGDYNLESGVATVTGSVRIVRATNELNGEYAHVNLNTGISKLFGTGPGGQGEGRVSGTFTPDKKDTKERRALFRGPGAKSGDKTEKGGP